MTPKSEPPKDLRSPLAKARDDWFESEAGQKASDASTLPQNAHPFLRNRLELAFLAGAAAQREINEKFTFGPQ